MMMMMMMVMIDDDDDDDDGEDEDDDEDDDDEDDDDDEACLYLCICRMFITRRSLYGLNLKKRIWSSWKTHARLVKMKKMAAESKTKDQELNPRAKCVANSC